MIIGHFWKEFQHLKQQTGPFAKFNGQSSMSDALNGISFTWLQHYTLLYTKILGFTTFCIASKQLRISAAKRLWCDVKEIKDGKQSNIGGVLLEKSAVIYSSARLQES